MDYNNEQSKVVFENEEFQHPRSFQTPTPGMVKMVIKFSGGAIKDEQQANYVLIGFVVLGIIVSLFLIFNSGSKKIDADKIVPPGITDPTKPFN